MAQNSRRDLTTTARARLAALREKKPPTKAAQIRALWPDIKAALDGGHTLQSVCECLEADGINVDTRSLAVYVSRIRRASAVESGVRSLPAANAERFEREGRKSANEQPTSMAKQSADPLANVRDRQRKRSAFDYRPELADPKELI
jgi:hypothetical protein